MKQGFNRAKVDTNLFIRRKAKHILLVQFYVDDIVSVLLSISFLRVCKFDVG